MKRFLAHVASFVAGLIVATALFLISDANRVRETSFTSLVEHTMLAADISAGDRGSLVAVSRRINTDLRIIFMRYNSFSAEERVVLRLVAKRAANGRIVLDPAIAARIAALS